MSEAVHEEAELEASPAEIWEVLMDPTRLGEWVSAHRELDDLPELPLVEGDRFRQKLGLGPASFWVEWEVVEADPPGFAHWRGTGPGGSTATVTYRLSGNGSTTTFRYENDFDPPGGVLGKAAKRVATAAGGRREARKSLKRLRELF